MKSICVLFFVSIYFEVQAQPFNLKDIYDDTKTRVLNFYVKIDYQMFLEEPILKAAEQDFLNQTREGLQEGFFQVKEVSQKYITDYEAWIRKVEEAKKNPSKCTQNKTEIEQDLPNMATENMITCYQTKSNASLNEIKKLNETWYNIPEVALQIQHDFFLCKRDDVNCINNLVKKLDDAKDLPDKVIEVANKINGTYPVILKILDDCITEAITNLDSSEKKLTDEGIQCLKDLIGK